MTRSTWCGCILAGGEGTRLRPLTAKMCKPMVPVCNRPMALYAIDHLRFAGIKKIVVIVKHLGDLLRKQIEDYWTPEAQKKAGIEIFIPNVNSEGTADAVRKTKEFYDADNFVVSMADIVTNLPMKQFMEYHEEKKAYATVSMKYIDQMATKYGNTLLDNNNRIIRFLEKPSSEEIYLSALTGGSSEILPIINTGIYCFKKDLIKDVIDSTQMMDFGMEIFPYLLENGYDLFGFLPENSYYWLDIGNPLTYMWSNWDMLRLYGWPISPPGVRQGDLTHIWYENNEKPPVVHADTVVFGKNNKYGQNVRVEALSSIGSNCVIGNNVVLDGAIVWDNVKIGNNVKIIQSVVANDVEIGDNVVIKSESVIGPNCKISAGKILDSKTLKEDSKI